jgi:hypothetical protein
VSLDRRSYLTVCRIACSFEKFCTRQTRGSRVEGTLLSVYIETVDVV